MLHRFTSLRAILAGLGAALVTSLVAPSATLADDVNAAESRSLPEGVEASPLDAEGRARALPEGSSSRELPDAEEAVRRRAEPPARRVVWEAKRQGAEERLRAVRLDLEAARERLDAACPEPEWEGCPALRRDVRELVAQERALEAYLEHGLLAECLGADCRPGWIGE